MEEKTFCVTLYLETKSLKTVQVRYRKRFNFDNFYACSKLHAIIITIIIIIIIIINLLQNIYIIVAIPKMVY